VRVEEISPDRVRPVVELGVDPHGKTLSSVLLRLATAKKP